MIDPRTPVVVGAGQVTQRPDDVADLADALDAGGLMAQAVCAAVDDSGRAALLGRIDTVCTARPLSRRYPDPARVVARRLGLGGVATVVAAIGGNSPQMLVNRMARRILRGEADVVAIAGAESMYTRGRAKREGVDLPWERPDDPPAPVVVGEDRVANSDTEMAHSALVPIQIYPLFETALRAARGRSVEEHQKAVSELCARLAAVAQTNPYAWSRNGWTAEEIRTPSIENRMVTFPYPKRMCANMTVDQGAGLIMCSYEAAMAAGVADDRLVFPLAGGDAHEHWFVTERWSLAESPGLRVVAHRTLDAAGIGVDDVARFDLYSCFPSAVQQGRDALGLAPDDPRPISLTGGLMYFGGPGNSFVSHSIAEAVEACRRDPGSISLVTGVGMYLTKHSVGLYATEPPTGGFHHVDDVQDEIDALPRRCVLESFDGEADVEATAVVYSRERGPDLGIVTLLDGAGNRLLANAKDADVLASIVSEGWEGRRVKVRSEGDTNRIDA